MCPCMSFIYVIYVLILYIPILFCGCLVRDDLIKYKLKHVCRCAFECIKIYIHIHMDKYGYIHVLHINNHKHTGILPYSSPSPPTSNSLPKIPCFTRSVTDGPHSNPVRNIVARLQGFIQAFCIYRSFIGCWIVVRFVVVSPWNTTSIALIRWKDDN